MQKSIIYFIGYRGTGKTTVAKIVADYLDWDFADADEILESQFQKSIRDIFAEEGESSFRAKESAILAELSQRKNQVVATGGGVVLRTENRQRLRETGQNIWLKASPETIWERMQADDTTSGRRPDLAQGGLAEIDELLSRREPLYKQCADWSVDTEGKSPRELADEVLQKLRGLKV